MLLRHVARIRFRVTLLLRVDLESKNGFVCTKYIHGAGG